MATQINTTPTSSFTEKAQPGFNQLAVGLRRATEEFEAKDTSDFFSFLKPAGDYLVSATRFTVGYARRHPVRMGITVAALALIAVQALRPKAKA